MRQNKKYADTIPHSKQANALTYGIHLRLVENVCALLALSLQLKLVWSSNFLWGHKNGNGQKWEAKKSDNYNNRNRNKTEKIVVILLHLDAVLCSPK